MEGIKIPPAMNDLFTVCNNAWKLSEESHNSSITWGQSSYTFANIQGKTSKLQLHSYAPG